MANSYVIFWSQTQCEIWKDRGANVPLSVLFGGHSIAEPALPKCEAGDSIYPITVYKHQLLILGRMTVAAVITIDEYYNRLNLTRETIANTPDIYNEYANRLIWGCDRYKVALGKNATILRFDFALPAEHLTALRLGAIHKEQPLRNIKDGKASAISLHGYYRRLSESSAAIFEEVMKGF